MRGLYGPDGRRLKKKKKKKKKKRRRKVPTAGELVDLTGKFATPAWIRASDTLKTENAALVDEEATRLFGAPDDGEEDHGSANTVSSDTEFMKLGWQTNPKRAGELLLPEDVKISNEKAWLGNSDAWLHGRFK